MSTEERAEGGRRRLAGSAASLLKLGRRPVAAAVLSVVLATPALGVGWVLDDYFHRTVLLDRSQLRDLIGPPSAMFRFFRGDPDRTGRLMDIGLLPWWTDPSLKGEFLQALAVLTHRLDYALWPNSAALMHAHSLFWLGTAVAATACLYRRILGSSWAAGVAALLFAVDDARGATVGFLANRNVLVAATFGVSSLIAHDRARREGSRLAGFLAPLLLLAALFSKEEGIGTCAYLSAYAMFIDPKGRRLGAKALAPYAVMVIAWGTLRAYWGYGVRDMGLYIDPLTDTERFLKAAAGRYPILLLGQWSPIPADLGVLLRPPLSTALWWIAVAFLGALFSVMAPLLRRDPRARFWASGMLLAVIPVSATIPMDRLLTFAGIGAAGLLAQFWRFLFFAEVAPPNALRRVIAHAAAWFLVAVHAVIAPIVLPWRAANPLGPAWIEKRLYVGAELGASLEDRTVIIVNAPSPIHAGILVLRRELEGKSVPRHTRVLAPAIPLVIIRCLDKYSLAIRPRGGYLRFVLDQVFRSERRRLAIGERVRLTGMTVTITSLTGDGRPAEATFRFDETLDSPSFLWLCFRGGGFEPFTPPAVGQEIEIRFDLKPLLWPSRPSSAPAARPARPDLARRPPWAVSSASGVLTRDPPGASGGRPARSPPHSPRTEPTRSRY